MNLFEGATNFRLAGRTTWHGNTLYLGYSASYIEFRFFGDKVTSRMLSDGCPEGNEFRAWVAVFLDGEEEPNLRFPVEKGCREYTIYESAQKREVTVKIMKYSEAAFASLGIQDIQINGELLELPAYPKKKIEFIGDSITCGYGIEGIAEKDIFTTAQENPWLAYACKTARILNADFELVSWSGNGVISHYVEESVNEPRVDKPLMPQLYHYSDWELEQRLGIKNATEWKTIMEPNIIVLHLGTNDASYTRGLKERNEKFEEAYLNFIKRIRKAHEKAAVLCTLGVMNPALNGSVRHAVERANMLGDENIFFLELPLQSESDGMGTDYHPTIKTHDKVAKILVEFIKEHGLW